MREGAIAWPWHLTEFTLFCFAFGTGAEVIDSWDAMLASARRVGGGGAQVYAHNLAPLTPPKPMRRQSVDVALVLNEVPSAQWNTAKLGDHFSKFDLSDAASATLRPCFRVALVRGGAHFNDRLNPSSQPPYSHGDPSSQPPYSHGDVACPAPHGFPNNVQQNIFGFLCCIPGLVAPVFERPLDFITAKALAMEPNSVMLLTICSA